MMMMTRFALAGAALALAVAFAASAMASDHQAGRSAGHVERAHPAGFGGTHHIRRSSGGSPAYSGGFIDLGPLGIMAACATYPRGHGYCGPPAGTPIDAWSR
jgi:hypothetical protein